MKKEYQIQPNNYSNSDYYGALSGYFSVSSRIDEENYALYRGSWHSCRETFSRFFTLKSKVLLMACGSNEERENCINFLSNCERRLKISKSKTVLCKENERSVLAVILNPWWIQNPMRRQLLTILLRAGRKYYGNFDYALESYGYSKQTKKCIYKFFDGYTAFPNFRGGWVYNFAPKKRWGYYEGRWQAKEFNSNVEKNLAKMQKD